MNCTDVHRSVGISSVGATHVDLDGVPLAGTPRPGNLWYIEGYSDKCERLFVDDVSSQQLLLSQPIKMQHPNNAFVFCLPPSSLTPHLYGSTQGSTESRQFANDQPALQRMAMEHPGVKWEMGFGYLGCNMGRPWLVPDGTHTGWGYVGFRTDVWDSRCTQTGIPNDFPSGSNALVKSFSKSRNFTANISNVITLSVALDLAVGDPVIFDDVYPDTTPVPVGIVLGRTYLVKSWNPVTKALTVSEVSTPGVELDITVAGNGMVFSGFTKGIMYGFDRMEWRGVIGADAAQLSSKPGAYTKDTRCFGTLVFAGLASHHDNMESQAGQPGLGEPDYPGVWWTGKAHEVDYINQNGGQIGGRYGPDLKAMRVGMHYVEGVGTWGQDIMDGCRGLMIKQQLNNRANNIATVHDGVGGPNTSFDVGPDNLQLTDHETHRVAGMAEPFRTQNGVWDWNEGDIRYTVPGMHKTPHGVRAKHRIGVQMASSGDEIWTHYLGRGQAGCIFTRSSGDLILPNPQGMEPGMEWWMYKQSNGPPYPGGTVNIKDHLGTTTLYTFTTAGDLKFVRYMPPDETVAYSASYWKVMAS